MPRKEQIAIALREAGGFWSVQEIHDWLTAEGVKGGKLTIRDTVNRNKRMFVAEPMGASGRTHLWRLQGLADDAT